MVTTQKTWRDLLGEAKTLYDQAKAILTDPNASAEQKARVQEIIRDAEAKRDEAMALKSILDSGIEQAIQQMQAEEEKQAALAGGKAIRGSDFKQWGEFLYCVWKAMNPNIKEPQDARLEWFPDEAPKMADQKDLSGQTGASGGFLIPGEFQAQLMAVMGEVAIVRRRATVIPMRRREITIPVLDQTSTTAGQPHWFGGLQFYWQEEASEKQLSEPEFRQMSLIAKKLIGYTRASDELLDDSAISLEAFLSGPLGFAGGAAWMEDYAFLRGTGAGTPLGVLNSPARITVSRSTPGTVSFGDLAEIVSHFLPSGRGVWIASQSLMSDIIQLKGPSGNESFIWIPNARDGIPGFLLGYPVIWTEKAPSKGYEGDIGLYDLSYYLIGDRQATTVESTRFDRWRFDQTSWRMVHRVDGRPWLSAPLTYQDGVTQVSPFVVLGGTEAS